MSGNWYYQVMGEVRGPVDRDDLHGLVNRNEINRDSYVRRERGDWMTADRVHGLFSESDTQPQSAEPKMYYQVMGEVRGPVSVSVLSRLANTNSISRDTFVRRDNEEWVTADQVPGLLH